MTTDEKVAEAVRLGGKAKIEDFDLSGHILRAYYDGPISWVMFRAIATIYHYGVIEGKRLERAKRKKI